MYLHRALPPRPCALALLSALSAACIPSEFPGQQSSSSTDATTESESTATTDTTEGPLECNNDGECDPGENAQNCMADCVIPPGCGDGTKDDSEACDDGTDNGTYGKCKEDCSGTTSCGDGKQNGPEKCDDGPDNNNDYTPAPHCNADCSALAPHCGDDSCEAGKEDGNSCGEDCKAGCGNGVKEPGEDCDEGEADTPTCDADCTLAECGDMRVNEAANETCEDGNTDDGDACVSCQAAVCGDGFVWAGMEECDDGNNVETDLCTSACTPVIERKVFVSSNTFNGKLGGLAGADAKCQALATLADLPNPTTFKAWLSDSNNGPADRFDTGFTGVYKLIDGTPVASGWTDLIDETLLHAINVTELGATDVDVPVWSHTTAKGEPLGTLHCMDWTSLAGMPRGSTGYSSALDLAWTETADTSSCGTLNALYCFEDPA